MRSPKVLRRLVLESLLGGGKVYVSRGDAAAHLEEEGIAGQYFNVGFDLDAIGVRHPSAVPILWRLREGAERSNLWYRDRSTHLAATGCRP